MSGVRQRPLAAGEDDVRHGRVAFGQPLRPVAYREQSGIAPRLAAEQLDQAVLGLVDVLVLVHQAIAKPFLVTGEKIGMGFEQSNRVEQEVVEIHGVVLAELGLVKGVHLGRLLHEKAARLLSVRLDVDQLVLRGADEGMHRPGTHFLLVPFEVPKGFLDEGQLVVGVVNRETGFITEFFRVGLEEAQAKRVEGADEQVAARRGPHQAEDAVLHRAGRLVGEGDPQEVEGRDLVFLEQAAHAVRDDAGFSGARARENQGGAVAMQDGLPLFLVQFIIATAHGTNPGRMGTTPQIRCGSRPLKMTGSVGGETAGKNPRGMLKKAPATDFSYARIIQPERPDFKVIRSNPVAGPMSRGPGLVERVEGATAGELGGSSGFVGCA